MKTKRLLAVLMSIVMLISVMPLSGLLTGAAEGAVKTVYVSANGNAETADGTQSAPFATVSAAMAAITAVQSNYAAGEIVILDNAASSSSGAFGTTAWTIPVTVRGDDDETAETLTLSGTQYLYGDTTFDNVTVANNNTIYAQHHAVEFTDTAALTGSQTLVLGRYNPTDHNAPQAPHELTLGGTVALNALNLTNAFAHEGTTARYTPGVDFVLNATGSINWLYIGGTGQSMTGSGNSGAAVFTDDVNITINTSALANAGFILDHNAKVSTQFQDGAALQIIYNNGTGTAYSRNFASGYGSNKLSLDSVTAAGGTLYVLKCANGGGILSATEDAGVYAVTEGWTAVATNGTDTYRSENDTLTVPAGIYDVTWEVTPIEGAKTVYVDAANGADTNDGSTSDQAVKTLAQAMSMISTSLYTEGQIVIVGNYTASAANALGVTECLKPVTICGAVDASTNTLSLSNGLNLVSDTVFDNITIERNGNIYAAHHAIHFTSSVIGAQTSATATPWLILGANRPSATSGAAHNLTLDGGVFQSIVLGNYQATANMQIPGVNYVQNAGTAVTGYVYVGGFGNAAAASVTYTDDVNITLNSKTAARFVFDRSLNVSSGFTNGAALQFVFNNNSYQNTTLANNITSLATGVDEETIENAGGTLYVLKCASGSTLSIVDKGVYKVADEGWTAIATDGTNTYLSENGILTLPAAGTYDVTWIMPDTIGERVYRLNYSEYDWLENDKRAYVSRYAFITGLTKNKQVTLSFDYFIMDAEASCSVFNVQTASGATSINGTLTDQGSFSQSFTVTQTDASNGIGVGFQMTLDNGLANVYIWNLRLTADGDEYARNLLTENNTSWPNSTLVEIMPEEFDPDSISRDSITLDSISVSTAPTKTVYEIGETLDTTGLALTLHYSDLSTKALTSGFTVSGFDSSTAGTKTLTVTYEALTTTFNITVNEAPEQINSIAVGSLPYKTVYVLGEELDIAGLVLTINCSDGTRTANAGYTVTGFESTTIGTKTLTVSYLGVTTTFTVTVNGYETPITDNTAILYNPQSSSYDQQAEQLRQTILNTADTVEATATGNKYYISYTGNDITGNGSKNNPWRTADKLATVSLSSGDAVLFERGGVYRSVAVTAVAGVSYGAYGTGAKPQLYGGDKNYAVQGYWSETSTENVWRVKITKSCENEDIGNVVFDHGEICASDGKELALKYLNEDYEFYYDANTSYLYLYLSVGNPGALHESIEICPRVNAFTCRNADGFTFENLCIKYVYYGISTAGCDDVTVRGCEIGYIGGNMAGDYTRAGNGIEIYGQSDGALVENCWIYQCYDAGYTNQGPGEQKNITVKNNLIEYCVYNIESWVSLNNPTSKMINCIYENNVLRFAGYGFGTNNRIGSSTVVVGNISCFANAVPCENFVIRNNVLDCSYRYVLCNVYPNDTEGRGPTITGNTWIQKNFSNSDTTACIGLTKDANGNNVIHHCSTLAQMQQSVAVFDTNPTAVILESPSTNVD